jgi:penicillin amidase
MKLQLNNYSLKAETALPYFLSQLDSLHHDLPNATTVIDMLKRWNYTYEADSKPPVYFDIWFEYFYTLCWDEIYTDSTKTHVATPSDQTTISLMIKNRNSVYFDIIKSSDVENSSDIINIAFDSLLHFLQIGDHSTMNWASFKDASISHMARIPALSISDLHASGTQDVINAHAKTFGPSWRMVVELTGEGPKAFGIYPGGQSGHPGSKYYSNMINDWLHGNYQILNYVESTNELMTSSSFTFEFKR